MIGIINYGMGNLTSVQNALESLNIKSTICDSPKAIESCDKIILPGVGAFGMAMQNLNSLNFVEPLAEFALSEKKPFLGICLGAQLLLESSTEHGFHKGLGYFKGTVDFLGDKVKDLPVPHMGWNDVIRTASPSALLGDHGGCFYFVHSYYCKLEERNLVTAEVDYNFRFDVVFERGNIFACQFHPEKSQKDGLSLLKNFAAL